MSAYHLDLRDDPYGADTDKQLFTLYAADTPDVREKNEQYGDDSDHRGADIKVRGKNWTTSRAPHLDDAMAWNALSDDERAKAIAQLESRSFPQDTTSPSTRSTAPARPRAPAPASPNREHRHRAPADPHAARSPLTP